MDEREILVHAKSVSSLVLKMFPYEGGSRERRGGDVFQSKSVA